MYLDWCGTFVTYDHLALRVWDLRGQLKCVHHDKANNDYNLVKIFTVPSLQQVMAVFTKKICKDSVNCGKIVVYSEFLAVIQEVVSNISLFNH